MNLPLKIISGGQTGADRAALDWAMRHGIPHGGWCHKGRLAEDGAIDQRYQLQQTPTSRYPQRTKWNVRDSDGTVVFSIMPTLTGGSKKTVELAHKHGKSMLHLRLIGSTGSGDVERADAAALPWLASRPAKASLLAVWRKGE